jgi:hypothetical protein
VRCWLKPCATLSPSSTPAPPQPLHLRQKGELAPPRLLLQSRRPRGAKVAQPARLFANELWATALPRSTALSGQVRGNDELDLKLNQL